MAKDDPIACRLIPFGSSSLHRLAAQKRHMAYEPGPVAFFRSSRSFDPGQDRLPKCRVQREPPFFGASLEELPYLVRKTH